jgi:ribosomal protein S18 acetylase RimI-like enzyme
MEVRHARVADIEDIYQVAMLSWKDAYKHIISEGTIKRIVTEWYDEDRLKEQVSDPFFYVAESEDGIVGFTHATVEGETASLHRIYIDPEYQRQGYGSRLYEKVEEQFEDGVNQIKVEVLGENEKGLNFYQKEGFSERKSEKIELGEEEVFQKVMVKDI